jgi:hypothetical protein
MADLTENTLRKLASYQRTRGGVQVPNTINGNLYDYACWNWVLSGATLKDSDPTSNNSIIHNVLIMNDLGGIPTGIKPTAAQLYPSSAADLITMADILQQATDAGPKFIEGNGPQTQFLECLVRIMMRANGLTPIAASKDNPYNVLVRSSNWWNTDHWALRVKTIGIAVNFIQTVPEHPLMFSCNKVWDENLAGVSVGLQSLLQLQVDQLATVRICSCRAFTDHRERDLSVTRFLCEALLTAGAGQCSNCGAVVCQPHLGSFDDAGVFQWGVKEDGSYKCQYCNNKMDIL